MLRRLIVSLVEQSKILWTALCRKLPKPLKLCGAVVELVMTLVVFGLVVIVLFPLTLLLVALFHSCTFMTQYAIRLYRRAIDVEQ